MTNRTHIWGVFASFRRARDVPDNEVHFQGPKWGFTQKKEEKNRMKKGQNIENPSNSKIESPNG